MIKKQNREELSHRKKLLSTIRELMVTPLLMKGYICNFTTSSVVGRLFL
jgi:hypothetical protein